MSGDLTPQDALRRIDDVDRRTRRPVRVAGWMFAFVGVATPVYWLIMFFGTSPATTVAGVAWVVMTAVVVTYVWQLRVRDLELTWVNRNLSPVTIAYVVLVLATFLAGLFLLGDDPGPVPTAIVVTLAIAAGIPPIYGAWRILRAHP